MQPVVERYKSARAAANSIETWSVNYQGKVPYDRDARSQTLKSGWFERRDDAVYQLKVSAAFAGYELLRDVKIHHRLEEFAEPSHNGKGTHYYNEPRYRAEAVACMRVVGQQKPGNRESR